MFACKFCEISKNNFFTEQLRATASANRKNINLVKMKDVDLNWQDFCKRGKAVKRLLTAPKKNYYPLVKPQKRPPDFHDFADKLKDIIPGSVLNTAVPKPKVDFVRETLKHEWNKDWAPNIERPVWQFTVVFVHRVYNRFEIPWSNDKNEKGC